MQGTHDGFLGASRVQWMGVFVVDEHVIELTFTAE